MTAKEIADYMVNQGIKECNDNNYCFYISDLEENLSVDIFDVVNMLDDILKELDLRKEVAECSYEFERLYFYITFYVGYCENNNKEIIDVKNALLKLKSAWQECQNVLNVAESVIDINKYIAKEYPFDKSFSDIDVEKWIDRVVGDIGVKEEIS